MRMQTMSESLPHPFIKQNLKGKLRNYEKKAAGGVVHG